MEQPEKYDKTACALCAFQGNGNCELDRCSGTYRSDKRFVIFKKLEKVGEPYSIGTHIFQRYKVFIKPYIFNDPFFTVNTAIDDEFISIEVKQNKEDMKEKEPTYEELLHYYHSTVGLWAIDKNPREVSLDWICGNAFQLGVDEEDSNSENIGKNLREFDIEAAKAGKPVCTRDGRKARIICFDKEDIRPIVALIKSDKGGESAYYYINGMNLSNNHQSVHDLMMLPERKEGWVNIYRNAGTMLARCIYNTREEAMESAEEEDYIDTVRVVWYE